VRIIAGKLRRRTIQIPSHWTVRPTTDRVREAVSNWLASSGDFDGTSVLDLFAGSGALGFEAFSRGAEEVTFVEKDTRVAERIRANAELLGVADDVRVVTAAAETWLGRLGDRDFDLIFADPPYGYADIEALPDIILKHVSPGGVLVFEHGKPGEFEGHPRLLDQRRYGRSNISFFGTQEA
jgi:16S rRNA (guanine966-N2)-methyltransferase